MYLLIETKEGIGPLEITTLLNSHYKKVQRGGKKVSVADPKVEVVEEISIRDVEMLRALKAYLSPIDSSIESLQDDMREKEDRKREY